MKRSHLSLACCIFLLLACHSPDRQNSRLQDPFRSQRLMAENLHSLPYVPSTTCTTPNWRSLNFAQSVEAGLCQHPDSRAAYAELEKQAALWGDAQGAYLPTLSVSYRQEMTHRKTDLRGEAPALHQHQHPGHWMAELQWVLFDFGERAARSEQHLQALKLAAAAYDRQLQQRFRNIATHYANLDSESRRVTIAKENMEIAEQSLLSAQTLHEEGVAIAADTSQAQVEFDAARLQLLQAERDRDNSAAALLESMGYPPDTPFTPTALPDEHFPAHHDEAIAAIVEKTLLAHPDIREAKAQLAATQAQFQATQQAGSPQVFLYANNQQQSGLRNAGLSYRERENVLGIGVRWPLFEGYRRHYQLRELLARQEQEEALLQSLESRLELEVRQAWRQLQTAGQARHIAEKSAEAARLNYETRLGRYREGIGGLADLLQAQRALNDMRQAHSNAIRDWHHAVLALMFSMGMALPEKQ